MEFAQMKRKPMRATRAQAVNSLVALRDSDGHLLPGRLLARPADHKACRMHIALDPAEYNDVCRVLAWAAQELQVRK